MKHPLTSRFIAVLLILTTFSMHAASVYAESDVNRLDGSWVLADARAPEPITQGTLTITGNSFTGTTACNRYGGTFSFDEEGFVIFHETVITERACMDAELMLDEERYMEAFINTRIMRITPSGTLTLQGFADDGSVVILNYERAAEPDTPTIEVIGVRTSATVEPGEETELSFLVEDSRSEGAPVRYFLNYGGNEYVRMLANPMQFSLGPGERETITVTASSMSIGRYSFDIEVLEEALVGTQEQRALASQTLWLNVYEAPVTLEGQWTLIGVHMPDGQQIERGTLHIGTDGFSAGTACNTVFGTLYYGVVPRQFIQIRVEGGTDRDCGDDVNVHERRYVDALNAVSSYSIERGELILTGSLQGTRFEMRFAMQDSDQPFEPPVIEPPGIQPIQPPTAVSMLHGYYVNEDRSRGGMIRIQYGGFQIEDAQALIVIGGKEYVGMFKLDGDPGTMFEIDFRCQDDQVCPQLRGTIRLYESLALFEGTLTMTETYDAVFFAHQWIDTSDTPAEPRYPPVRTHEREEFLEEARELSVIPEPEIIFHGVERPRILGFIPNPFAQPLARISIRTDNGVEQRTLAIGSVIEIEGARYQVYADRIETI